MAIIFFTCSLTCNKMLLVFFSQAVHKVQINKKNCPVEGGHCYSYSFKKEEGGGGDRYTTVL